MMRLLAMNVLLLLMLPAISLASTIEDCLSLEDATKLANSAVGDLAFPVCPTEEQKNRAITTFVLGKNANIETTTALIEAFFYQAVSISSYYNFKRHFNVVRFGETSQPAVPFAIVPEEVACPAGMNTRFKGMLANENEIYKAKFCR